MLPQKSPLVDYARMFVISLLLVVDYSKNRDGIVTGISMGVMKQ